jgi:glycosyltransferase involved in cell wall biosynthesis
MITVIVPALNEENYIGPCLETLAMQDPQPDEILVVDNGSTDKTVQVVEQFFAAHPEIDGKLIFESKKGCIAARETGWRTAKGDIIIHVDADETFPSGWMQQVHDVLKKHPELAAFGGTVRFPNPPLLVRTTQFLFNRLYSRLLEYNKGFPFLCGGMTICKREVLEKINGYADIPADQLEDYYLSEQAHRLGYKTRYFPDIYAFHSLRRYEKGGIKAHLAWGVAGVDAKFYDPGSSIR